MNIKQVMQINNINKNYEDYYAIKKYLRVYPTEFVVRAFLQKALPNLNFKQPVINSKVLEIGFGDGRNTVFLCEQGYDVVGVEITEGICHQTANRMKALGYKNFKFFVGRNAHLPFKDDSFEYILASHSCYYIDEGESFMDNMKEYARVLKKDGYAIFSIVHIQPNVTDEINIMNQAEKQSDGTYIINKDPLGIRNGCRFQAFETKEEVKNYLSPMFTDFIFGTADNNWFGVTERVFWVIAKVNKD